MTTFSQYPGAFGANVLSIALIGPDEQRRKMVFTTLAGSREYSVQEYPFYPDLEDVSGLLEQNFEVVMVDLDSDPEYALGLVSSICTTGATTVMVYSGQADSRLLMRCMRAGAREFLTVPVTSETMAEALAQLTGRRNEAPAPAAYSEPIAPQVEAKKYEQVGGISTPEVRAYEPDIRSSNPDIRPRGLYPNYDPGTRARAGEPSAPRPEVRPYEPVAGIGNSTVHAAAQESRPYEPVVGINNQSVRPLNTDSRTFPPEQRSYDPVVGIGNPSARTPSLEPRSFAPESRSYEPAAGLGNTGVRGPNPEPRSYEPINTGARASSPEPRSYEPVAGLGSAGIRNGAEPRSYEPAAGLGGAGVRGSSGETRSYEPVNTSIRSNTPESRPYEPAAGMTSPSGRVPTPETRPFSVESRSFEQPAANTGSRASVPDSRPFGNSENRSFESGAGAASPGTRILNPNTRSSNRGSRLQSHGSRFSNPDVRATNPDVRSAAPEVRPAIPEIRPVIPEVRPVVPEARPVIVPEVRPAPQETRAPKRSGGKVLVFLGAKGGSGTTSIACNFSTCLAHESGKKTLLIDLHLPLGNVALELGVKPQYSIVDALRNAARLDSNFLSKLLAKHRTGLFVLASPDKFTPIQTSKEAIDKLLTTAKQEFDYVVIDVGARLDLSEFAGTALLEESSTVFLVTQDNVAELRNSNRLITEYFSSGGPKLEIVLNRYTPRISGIGMYSSHLVDEKHISAALTKSPEWRIPQDSSDILLPVEGSPVSRMFQNMARMACELEAVPETKKRPSLTDQPDQTISLFK